jgi:hypothetical protein
MRLFCLFKCNCLVALKKLIGSPTFVQRVHSHALTKWATGSRFLFVCCQKVRTTLKVREVIVDITVSGNAFSLSHRGDIMRTSHNTMNVR